MGKMIVLTGIDGCGKTTQIKKLQIFYQGLGIETDSCKLSHFSDTGYKKLRDENRRLFERYEDKNLRLICTCLSLREKIYKQIIPRLENNVYVFVDRYLESIWGIAREYPNGYEILRVVFDEIIKPDMSILLDVKYSTALSRMRKRNMLFQEEITPLSTLEVMNDYYKNMFDFYPLTVVDGEGSVETVTKRILAVLDRGGRCENGII